MKRKVRRRRSRWIWADNGVQTTSEGPTPLILSAYAPILPPTRVSWILQNEARGRNYLVVDRILLWAYLTYFNTASSVVPGIDLGIAKFMVGSTGTVPEIPTVPFGPPVAPAAAGTAWYGAGSVEESDGLDPYLWSGHIPSSDRQFFNTDLATGLTFPNGWGMYLEDATNGTANFQQNAVNGYGTFQPTHDLQVKRKLFKEEGLVLFASSGTLKSETESCEWSWHVRILAH